MCWTLDACDGNAARAARKEATAALRALTDSEEMLGAVELVIGELLSNAARHTDGNVCLAIGSDNGHAEISVYDSSTAFTPKVTRPLDEMAEHGRGLFIISKLTSGMSMHPFIGVGKRVSVTFELPLDERRAGFAMCERPWLRHDSGLCLAPRIARYRSANSRLAT